MRHERFLIKSQPFLPWTIEPPPKEVEIDNHPDRPAQVRHLSHHTPNDHLLALPPHSPPRQRHRADVRQPSESVADDPVPCVGVEDGKGNLCAGDAEGVGLSGCKVGGEGDEGGEDEVALVELAWWKGGCGSLSDDGSRRRRRRGEDERRRTSAET